MTDLLEEDLLSDEEKAPKHVTQITQVPTVARCPECGATFEGAMRNAWLDTHRRSKHGVKGSQQPKKKATAKKKAPQTKPVGARIKESLASPVAAGRRKPASDIIRRLFVTGAKVVAVVDAPVAACLVFEAPAAGDAIDKAIAGSFVDRLVVQKLAGASERWEALGSVLTLPVMVAMLSRFPQLFDALEDDLREAVEDIMIANVPAMRRKAERQRKAAAAFAELTSLDPVLAASGDPVGEILRGLLPAYVFDPSLLPEPEDVAVPAQ